MTIIDVNVLVHAKMTGMPAHPQAKAWLDSLLQSDEPVRLPWAVLVAFVRILGHHPEREHTMIRGFPVQWLATHGLTEEAVKEAQPIEFDGVQGRVFRAEHLVAIAASVGRTKNRARIEQMLEQSDLDRALLDAILSRHHLKLPAQ